MNKDRIILLYLASVPGLGQLYNGQKKKGFLLLSCWLVLFILGLIFVMSLGSESIRSERVIVVLEGLLGVPFIGLYIFSFYDSVVVGNEFKSGASEMSGAEQSAHENSLKEAAKNQVGYVPDLSQRIPEGGFKRKVKGTPRLEPLSPLPDDKQKSKSND